MWKTTATMTTEGRTHPTIVLLVVLSNFFHRVLFTGILLFLGRSSSLLLVCRFFTSRRSVRLDSVVAGRTCGGSRRTTGLSTLTVVDREEDLLRVGIDGDGGRRKREVTVDLVETRDGTGRRRGRSSTVLGDILEEVGGSRISSDTSEYDTSSAIVHFQLAKLTIKREKETLTHKSDDPPRRLAP